MPPRTLYRSLKTSVACSLHDDRPVVFLWRYVQGGIHHETFVTGHCFRKSQWPARSTLASPFWFCLVLLLCSEFSGTWPAGQQTTSSVVSSTLKSSIVNCSSSWCEQPGNRPNKFDAFLFSKLNIIIASVKGISKYLIRQQAIR